MENSVGSSLLSASSSLKPKDLGSTFSAVLQFHTQLMEENK